MKKRVVLAMVVAAGVSTAIALLLFYLVTTLLAEHYIAITGKLMHHDPDENKALLHLVSQGSVLGSLGGSLYIGQLLNNYIAKGELPFIEEHCVHNYFLYAMLIPLKGLIAGIIGATIVGGVIFLAGGLELLSKGHLFIIGCSCICGYSEMFLQQVVDLTMVRLKKVGDT
uniref:Uncharacterized protein n=1 Tax=Candidatus Kentrum sp. DK TaxID=2126562 RepID=A0A450TMI2_9GAMM|nr:MAG: hypothetical protein BECKDK2373C_GA0170839_11992 [Candidatus Kentron sp. DK]